MTLNDQAKTPTEKCYRSTYRAARHGSTIHDQSYMAHLTLSGDEEALSRVFDQICDPLGPNPCSVRSAFKFLLFLPMHSFTS